MPREFVVFLPLTGGRPDPLETARALTAHLHVGRAEIGQDALTGGVEVRFYWDAALLTRAKTWLRERSIVFDVNVL